MSMSPPAPPAPGSLNASEVNIFGLHQYDGATSFFTGDYLLPQVHIWGFDVSHVVLIHSDLYEGFSTLLIAKILRGYLLVPKIAIITIVDL